MDRGKENKKGTCEMQAGKGDKGSGPNTVSERERERIPLSLGRGERKNKV